MKHSAPPRSARTPAAIFAVPCLLALVSAAGLVAALLTDGPVDLVWSGLIAMPLLAMLLALLRRTR